MGNNYLLKRSSIGVWVAEVLQEGGTTPDLRRGTDGLVRRSRVLDDDDLSTNCRPERRLRHWILTLGVVYLWTSDRRRISLKSRGRKEEIGCL